MTLNALNQPRYSFNVTAVAVAANIALNTLFIPLFGINGAAIATLISIIIYLIGGHIMLRKYIVVKMERKPVISIIKATAVMALIITGFRIFLPYINLPLLICLIITGAVTYFVTLLKIDRDIHDELKEITVQIGIKWPNWL
jgi:O-antigen/teichoic acid export membrane protein